MIESSLRECADCTTRWTPGIGAMACPKCGSRSWTLVDAIPRAATSQGAANRIVCAGCGQPWFSRQAACSNCGGRETAVDTPGRRAALRVGGLSAPAGSPQGVAITSVRLTWGDAFDIFGKFAAVFIFWQVVTAAVIYLLIRLAS